MPVVGERADVRSGYEGLYSSLEFAPDGELILAKTPVEWIPGGRRNGLGNLRCTGGPPGNGVD